MTHQIFLTSRKVVAFNDHLNEVAFALAHYFWALPSRFCSLCIPERDLKNLDLRHIIAIFIHLRTINTEEYSANLGNKFYKKSNKMGYSGKMPNAETLWF